VEQGNHTGRDASSISLGSGKTPVLAVDADANSNLNEVLGVEVRSTIGEAREVMKKDVPTGMTKDIWFDYKVQEALIEAKGFDLIAMGRPEGPGCYLCRQYPGQEVPRPPDRELPVHRH